MQVRRLFSPSRLGGSLTEVTAIALCLTSTLGILGIAPLLIGRYVDGLHLLLQQASLIVSIEVAAAIATLLGVSSLIARASLRRISIIGALMGAVSYFIGSALSDFWAIAICRAISGAGVGLIGAAVNASVARAKEPERLYASALTLYAVLETIKLYGFPVLYGSYGYWTLFVSVGFIFLITAGASLGLNETPTAQASAAVARSTGSLRWIATPRVFAMLFGYSLMWIAFSMIWAFAERKATGIGMSAGAIGATLAAANIVGLLGSVIANQLGVRLGRIPPIFVGGTTLGICFYCIGATSLEVVYVAAIIMYGVAYFFVLPYILGIAVQLDRQGRVSVINSMMPWVAHLVSPLLGATVLTKGSFGMMGAISAATVLSATGFVVSAGRNRHGTAASAAVAGA